MKVRKFFYNLHLFKECEEYNLGLWECPSFIFFILGVLNIGTMLTTYAIANRFTEEPEIVALLVLIVTAVFFVISHIITQGFDKLAQANKMKTEFVSVASHQLRTPLAAMRWALNLLTDSPSNLKDEEKRNFTGIVKENNDRMIKLVNDLLDVSRIDMGRMILNPRQTNVYVLAQKMINSFAAFAKANNVEFSIEAAETLPNVFADPDKLSIVIQNLVDNAVKYSKNRGEVKIIMTAENSHIKVAVKDNGVGIPADQQKYIFQKFFRSDNVMKNQTVGTGLGLFIAKSIIEESGGKMWFESKENLGTTFYFTLPVYK